MRLAVEREALADDVEAARETPLPVGVAEQHDGRTARPVFLREKTAAVQRLHAVEGEIVCRDLQALHLLRVAAAGDRETVADRRRDVGEHLLLRPHGEQTRPGKADLVELALGHRRGELHELLGMRVGQGPQENGVDDAEDRAVGADPEGESEHGDKTEAG